MLLRVGHIEAMHQYVLAAGVPPGSLHSTVADIDSPVARSRVLQAVGARVGESALLPIVNQTVRTLTFSVDY
jgi:hypothetical protein